MKTNVTLKSSDRNLFGVTIKQNTKDGQSLSVSDLMKSYELARFQYGWNEKNITMIMKSQGFIERCYHLLHEREMIKLNYISFMDMIEREGIVKVLKGLKVWKTSGRGENKSTYSDPYIWVLLAMELNPLIYAKVVIWLTDSLIINRILAGTEFLPMNREISKVVLCPNYPMYSKLINERVFGYHERGMRDTASQEQLLIISDIEKFIINAVKIGIIRNEETLLKVIKMYEIKILC